MLARARSLLSLAEKVLVLTGAGISAESGVPTFRGPDGFWQHYRPEDLATPEAFARNPRLVWEWYAWRRDQLATCRPNSGHLALARWILGRHGVTLVTQNVDNLHEAAARAAAPPGTDPALAYPVRLHGSIAHLQCTACEWREERLDPIDTTSEATLPRCPACRALARPGVVWFGEMLPAEALIEAGAAARQADVCLVVGTAGVVYPAAGLAFDAKRHGATLIVVDPGETGFDEAADLKLEGKAGVVLPELLAGGPP